jgi:sec-independent protein translocase protein TatC
MSVFDHLDELRRRVLWCLLALVVTAGGCFALSRRLLEVVLQPLRSAGLRPVFLSPLEPVYTSLKLSLVAGVALASPVLFYQIIAFVLPALRPRERRHLFAYLPAGVGLMLAGLAFGYFVFVPFVLRFALRFAGGLLAAEISIERYVTFLLGMTLPFGVLFELPVIVLTLVKLGVLRSSTLARGRKWAVLATVVAASIFAPPDMVSPILMGLPVYGLYEVSIWVARLAERGSPAGLGGGLLWREDEGSVVDAAWSPTPGGADLAEGGGGDGSPDSRGEAGRGSESGRDDNPGDGAR